MNEAQRRAVELARFYFRRIAEAAGAAWDGDNDVEVELMVGYIIDAARADLRGQLDGVLAQIRVLDRLRPTCVLCLDAAADRQTSRGPACTDCVGDLPDDAADPDRPETWAFGEPPLTVYPDHEPPGHGGEPEARCPETSDGEHCGDWHDGGRCGACGQYGPDPEEGQ